MSDQPINFKVEAARRDQSEGTEWSIEDALRAALYEYENREDPTSLFCDCEPTDVYIAFRTTDNDGGEFFPNIASSHKRLSVIGLLYQHIHNLC